MLRGFLLTETHTEPFRVAFVRTVHTVVESEGSVEVCVNLTVPGIETDILDEFVRVNVGDHPNSVYIPNNTVLASKNTDTLLFTNSVFILFCFLAAPDMPDFLGQYEMSENSDFQQQMIGIDQIRDKVINATVRIICYDQVIYDDGRLEESEFAGLTLKVQELSSVATTVEPGYENAAIQILDDDSELFTLQHSTRLILTHA